MVSHSPLSAARDAITASGLRHNEVAAYLGIDAPKLSKSLSGVRRFSQTELERLAELTGVDVEALRPSPKERHTSPNPRHSGEEFALRQQKIVDTAWPLFTSRGYQAVTIADIARSAGISTSAVLYYFQSKNDIFIATLDRCSEQAAGRRSFVAEIPNPAERLLTFAEVTLDGSPESFREWTTWAQFWASSTAFEDAKHATVVAYARWEKQMRSIVEDGIATGCFNAQAPEPMINAVTAMIDGLGVRMLAGTLSPAAAKDAVTAYLNTWIEPPDAKEFVSATPTRKENYSP